MGREIASAGAVGTPTAAGLTFSFVAGNNPGTDAFTCASGVWTATAGSNGSGAITVNLVSSSQNSGFGVWVFRNSQGVGNHAEQHTATKTVSLTPIAADGAIVWGVFDFAATAITGISATPTPTDERQKVLVGGGAYTIYVEDLTDQTSAGSVSYGITGGSGTGPFSIVSLEIKHQ
jgi:hypothetical protein